MKFLKRYELEVGALKKILVISTLVVLLSASLVVLTAGAKPPSETGNGIDLTGKHYNLNLIGKKSDWNGGGDYDNPDRHTMFIPEDTSTFSYETPDGVTHTGSIGIEFTRGTDFAVKDGNAFDDGWCQFEVGKGTYRVFITCKAKPGYTSDIGAWVYAEDDYGKWYTMDVGQIEVKGRNFVECTDLFYVSADEDVFGLLSEDMWVFDYLDFILNYDFSLDDDETYDDIVDAMYLWDVQNNGNKLIKLRFYEA